MPPSPVMRYSPRREPRADNHKRGRSLESGILFKDKDDDLALFNEVQSREQENFLLQSNDDFEDTFSTKLRYFSDFKLGISIPARGESSDLLNAETDKNDYDWLLTPPDTPLFPSLDDEAPPVNPPPRGRPRSQPISISRSSTMEKSYRSSRGSPSPNRLSTSPRSGSSTHQLISRPSSAPHSSPPPTFQHSTPRRPSPPPSAARRSSTPTPRRMSTGSRGAAAPSRIRGTSPIKTSRGNSASPKIKAWQSNIPGFSSEAPPNLRTSLADRPVTYVRGSSPASRNGSKSGRQSMSPTPSRSAGSSHSHERDKFSSYSKGSVASSGDDDVDSLQSIPISISDRSTPRSVGTYGNSRAPGSSKKPTRIMSASSAPKRSFDMALRQMDHRKGPQNMFRPLLSSVPSSTFYVGKAGSAHRPLISRNSSVTTSSNASSDQGTSGIHETEECDQNQEDVNSECVTAPYPDVQDEDFVLDNTDAFNEDLRNTVHDGSPNLQSGDFDGKPMVDSQFLGSQGCSEQYISIPTTSLSEVSDARYDLPNVDDIGDLVLCARCGRKVCAEFVLGDVQLCLECKNLEESSSRITPLTTAMVDGKYPEASEQVMTHEPFDALDAPVSVHDSLVTGKEEAENSQYENNACEGGSSCRDPNWNGMQLNSMEQPVMEEGGLNVVNPQAIGQPTIDECNSDGDTGSEQLQHSVDQNPKVDVLESAGISVLLKKSASGKGHVVQSRSFTATRMSYDDLSYVRDSANSTRSSVGRGSASASSSIDLGSSRQAETRIQRQFSGKKSEMDYYRNETYTKHQRSISSLSGTSSQALQASSLTASSHDDGVELSATPVEKDVLQLTCINPEEQLLGSDNMELDYTGTDVASISRTGSELSCHAANIHFRDPSVASVSNCEESAAYENGESSTNNLSNVMEIEASSALPETSAIEENGGQESKPLGFDNAEVPHRTSLDVISEMEIESSHDNSSNSQSDIDLPNSDSSIDQFQDPCVHVASNIEAPSIGESNSMDNGHGILEESTVMLEGQGGAKARSLTLEEATDTILFCSSIVHNLAYEAANIAIEKENSVQLEDLRPTVTILGRSQPDRGNPRARTTAKRTSKSQKSQQKRMEADVEPTPADNGSHEKLDVATTRIVGAPNKGDSLKPPKLESKCNCTIM